MRVFRIVMSLLVLLFLGLGIYMYLNDINYTNHVHMKGFTQGRSGTKPINSDSTYYFTAPLSFVFSALILIVWILYERSER